MKTKFLPGLQAAVIILTGIWVFWPAVHGDWVWDDAGEIARNPALRDPSGIWKTWVAPASRDYFPLKTTVQWLEWRLWGEDRPGYHLTSVALHLVSALLFWWLLVKLRQSPSTVPGQASRIGIEWLGGLLFVVHPLAVESVAWIAELKNTLSLPFLLCAMIAYVDFDRMKQASSSAAGPPAARRRRRYLISLLCFLLAMLAKSSVAMFPLVLLLYAWWRWRKITGRDLLDAAPFFAVALILGFVTVWFQQHRVIGDEDLAVGGLGSRLAGAGLAVVFYLWKFFVPIGLMPVYPRWSVVPLSPLQFWPWLALGALVGWLWTKRAAWGRSALFALGCFGVNLLPVLGLVPMFYLSISWVADHLVYLPMLGLIGLVVGGGGLLADRLARMRSGLLAPLGALAGILLCALGFASHRYAAIFRDNETFWNYALLQNPQSWMVHSNLSILLASQPGRQEDVLAHLEAAVRLKPDLVGAQVNLANLLASQPGRQADALAHYEAALRLKPDFAEAHCNLANLLASQPGREADALAQYETALRLKPDFAEAHYNLGALLAREPGRVPDAIAQYETALRLKPDYAEAHNNLAVLLSNQPGREADAIAHYEAALRLKPDYVAAHYNLARFLSSQPGREAEAIAHYEAALRLDPGFAAAREALERLRRFGQSPP